MPLDDSSKDITSFIVPQGHFRFTVLPMGLKPSCDFFNPVTQILEQYEHRHNIKIVNDVGGGEATALGVCKKVISLLKLCQRHGITVNPDKFVISRKIELGVLRYLVPTKTQPYDLPDQVSNKQDS